MDTPSFNRLRDQVNQECKELKDKKQNVHLLYLRVEKAVNEYLKAVQDSEDPEEEKADTKKKMQRFLQRNKKFEI
ncbi:hypothetical protein DMENIID0001_026000 [Sergentomyia squamirostris]